MVKYISRPAQDKNGVAQQTETAAFVLTVRNPHYFPNITAADAAADSHILEYSATADLGAICCDPRSGINKYSPTNERKNRVKNTRWRSYRVFFTRFFLEFGVNI